MFARLVGGRALVHARVGDLEVPDHQTSVGGAGAPAHAKAMSG